MNVPNAMSNQEIMQKRQAVWEHEPDPRALDLLRQAVQLILKDRGSSAISGPVDNGLAPELNESTPVENKHSITHKDARS